MDHCPDSPRPHLQRITERGPAHGRLLRVRTRRRKPKGKKNISTPTRRKLPRPPRDGIEVDLSNFEMGRLFSFFLFFFMTGLALCELPAMGRGYPPTRVESLYILVAKQRRYLTTRESVKRWLECLTNYRDAQFVFRPVEWWDILAS